MALQTIPQWEWVLLSEAISATTLHNQTPGFDFYHLTVNTGDPAPDPIVEPNIPLDSTELFKNRNVFANADEHVLEFQGARDLYVFCFNKDMYINDDGIVLVKDGTGNSLPNNPTNNGLDVNMQDQTTPTIIEKFNQVTNQTTVSVDGVQGEYEITIADVTGVLVGTHLILFNGDLVRFTSFNVLAINTNTLTLDSPLDVAYPIGTFVDITFTNMAVDGSGTAQVFGLRGLGIFPGLNFEVDITRVLITCFTTSAVDLSKFGDLPKLTRGLLLRDRNGEVYNIFNVKDNGEIAGITLDWIPYSAQNIQQGQHGFTARLTFAGQSKLGVARRLPSGQDLEFLVQDDLLLLNSLEIYGEGHVVD